ncbi:MAG: hypothetical protein UZ19_OD1000869 [Parcubacteria bacterium OLB19]|nr:MAG: hypothetical protein UZ19_OD1000869 [Parcubacteria bacterium OLB19]
MKYIKNLVLVLCFVFPNIIWAETPTQDCSVLSNEEINKYPIDGLPTELSGKLNRHHLTTAFNSEGKKIIFYETDITHSILLPQMVTAWKVSFSDGKFVVDGANRFIINERISFFMIIMVISVIFSGFAKNNDLSLSKRPAAIGILVGALVGTLSSSLHIGSFAGGFAGGVAGGFAGGVAGGFAGGVAGAFIISYGLAAAITKEWYIFCSILIVLEYTIVFYRRYKERSVLAKT